MIGRAWDAHLSIRTLWLSGATAALSMAVIAATEEGGGWPARLALWAIGAPIMGGVGAWVAVRWSRARGEARVWETMGVTPLRMAWGAVVAGSVLGLVGSLTVAAGWAEPLALAPPPVGPFDWVRSADGMLSPSQGIFVASDGTTTMVGASAPRSLPLPAWPVAAMIASLATTLPAWLCLPARVWWRGLSTLVASAALVFSFHGGMSGVWPPSALLVAPGWIALDTALRAWRGRSPSRHVLSRRG